MIMNMFSTQQARQPSRPAGPALEKKQHGRGLLQEYQHVFRVVLQLDKEIATRRVFICTH